MQPAFAAALAALLLALGFHFLDPVNRPLRGVVRRGLSIHPGGAWRLRLDWRWRRRRLRASGRAPEKQDEKTAASKLH